MTALKFAELSVKAGIPKGVINILPGSGNEQKYRIHIVKSKVKATYELEITSQHPITGYLSIICSVKERYHL